MKKLVIIDGKSVFYRGYYAMGALSLSDGTATGGVYGFAAISMEIIRDLEPDVVVVAWDSPTSAEARREIYDGYKRGRTKPGEDFYAQIPLLKELVRALGWEFVEIDRYEADDIIGTLVKQADEAKEEWVTFIVSSDLDMLQVVDDNTRMYRLLKGFSDIEEIDVAAVEEKYGIRQAQFLDLKALKGDASDRIPGVPGVGEKTAVKLLNQYGTLEGVYKHIDEIKGAVGKKLIAGRESAFMSYELGKIKTDAPVKLSEMRELVIEPERIIDELKKLEFNSLVRKYQKELDTFSAQEKQSQDFQFGSTAKSASLPSSLRGRSAPLINTRTRRCRSSDGKVGDFALNAPKFENLVIACDVKGLMHQDEGMVERILGGAEYWDLRQAEFLLNPLVREKLEEGDFPDQEAKVAKAREQFERFQKEPKVYKIFMEFDQPMIPVLYKMERAGMKLDRKYFERLDDKFYAEVEEISEEIYGLAGEHFNLNSPMQLSDILFNKLMLSTKGIKKNKSGYSTGAKELAKLAAMDEPHPIIEKIFRYREVEKLLTTYVLPLPKLADKNDYVHTTFTQDVTATGRLSSVNPNLQNIPVRTEEGKKIRQGFVAPEGKKIISADYSQFELRLAAVLAEDEGLVADFNSGVDIHTKTASEAFGVPFDEVTKNQRRAAKVINFGVLYGMSAKGLADASGMNVTEAAEFIKRYFEIRKPIRLYLDKVLAQARGDGYVETYYGRRRPTPDVKSANYLIRTAAERAAQNMPIQGTEADLMKRAMIRADKELSEIEGVKMIMQVHDSIMVECYEADVEKVSEMLKEVMEGVAPELKIKLAVEVKVGENWGEA
jgi:DNA polymerase-1